MEPWQKAIVLREARRLETYIRRWRWILLARMRASLADEFGLTPSTGRRKVKS